MSVSKPWECVPDLWKTEKSYLNWLRGQIRRIWSRHPIKHRYVAQQEVISVTDAPLHLPLGCTLSPRTKKLRQCEMCRLWWPPSKLEVDHIHGGVGFDNYEEFLEWQERILFVSFDDIRELCKTCHADVTLSQKLGCTLEEVPKERERIEFGKLKATKQNEALVMLGIKQGKNPAERVALFNEYLEKKYKGYNR